MKIMKTYDIGYIFNIDKDLKEMNDGKITKAMWESNGSHCISVDFNTKIGYSGTFYVNYNNLVAFAEKPIGLRDTELMLNTFKDMLNLENYVENVYLTPILDEYDQGIKDDNWLDEPEEDRSL